MDMKKITFLGGFVSVALAAGIALAGARLTEPVQVDTTSRNAYGAIGSARNSIDGTQYISCGVNTYANGLVQGGCSARTATGVQGSCTFNNNPSLAAAIQSMTSDSLVNFSWDASGTCWFVHVDNSSEWEPKK
jgi:hypothetical protein